MMDNVHNVEDLEDLNHLIRCARNTTYRNKLWTERWWTKIKGQQICPCVMKVFWSAWKHGLAKAYMGGHYSPPNNIIGHPTFEAFINQQDIGWDQAIWGRISVNWGKGNALAIPALAIVLLFDENCGCLSNFWFP